MNVMRLLFTRQVTLYLVLMLMAGLTVQWKAVHQKRGLYLLGIFYNGDYQNCRDAKPFVSFMRRVMPADKSYQQLLTACPNL